jgi:hypothetical protein
MVNDLTPPSPIHTNEIARRKIITKIEPKQNEAARMLDFWRLVLRSALRMYERCAPTDRFVSFSYIRCQALISDEVYKTEFRGVKFIQQAIFKAKFRISRGSSSK